MHVVANLPILPLISPVASTEVRRSSKRALCGGGVGVGMAGRFLHYKYTGAGARSLTFRVLSEVSDNRQTCDVWEGSKAQDSPEQRHWVDPGVHLQGEEWRALMKEKWGRDKANVSLRSS